MAAETAQAPQEALVQTTEGDEFSNMLKQSFKPRTERAATEVENAVKTLVEQALGDSSLIKSDVLDTIEEMIAQLDKKLSAQMNAIMHAPEFQQIESAWRGLKYMVFQSETDAMLKIRVMNVGKSELYRHLRQYPNAAWDQSPLFKKIYEEEFGQLGGQPYGCLVGDYYFSHLPTDVQLMRDLSKIAAAAHAPFFAAADSTPHGDGLLE
ncbi:type VI secretion system ImpC/EvpB family protein [Bradyrhizobium sp. GM22.5]